MNLKYHNSDLVRDLKRRGGGPAHRGRDYDAAISKDSTLLPGTGKGKGVVSLYSPWEKEWSSEISDFQPPELCISLEYISVVSSHLVYGNFCRNPRKWVCIGRGKVFSNKKTWTLHPHKNVAKLENYYAGGKEARPKTRAQMAWFHLPQTMETESRRVFA